MLLFHSNSDCIACLWNIFCRFLVLILDSGKDAHKFNLGNPELWLQLVEARGKTHPQEALDFYRPKVEPAIQTTSNDGYDKAVRLLKLMAPLMKTLGRLDEFQAWVDALSVTYKRKRNFTKLLKQAKLIS